MLRQGWRLRDRVQGHRKGQRRQRRATIAEPPGIPPENAHTPTRAKAKAKDFNENATTAERRAIGPASTQRTKELGANEDTGERGAREDAKEKAKASGRLMAKMPKDILTGTSRTSWIKMDTKL